MGAIRIAPFFRTQALFYTHASASRPLTAVLPQGHQRTVLLLALSKPATLYVSEAILAEYTPGYARTRPPGGARP